jgi:hypothetical protein
VSGDSEADAPPRVLAEFNTYIGLMAALRQRAQQRRPAVDDYSIAGQDLARLLRPVPVKRIRMESLGELLRLLNCKLVMVHDEEAVQKYGHRIGVRNEAFVHSGVITLTKTRQMFAEMGIKGNFLRWSRVRAIRAAASRAARIQWDSVTPKQRAKWARRMNQIRWHGNGHGHV